MLQLGLLDPFRVYRTRKLTVIIVLLLDRITSLLMRALRKRPLSLR
jgi:hypothetical protein